MSDRETAQRIIDREWVGWADLDALARDYLWLLDQGTPTGNRAPDLYVRVDPNPAGGYHWVACTAQGEEIAVSERTYADIRHCQEAVRALFDVARPSVG